MVSQNIAVSTTSEKSNTQGKVCTVGRFITAAEAKKIVDEAATWVGTPYKLVGAKSMKGVDSGADCSGATNKIYVDAGFPYPYIQSTNMVEYITRTSRFRRIEPEKGQALQAGDIIVWPRGHVAIYMLFTVDHPMYKSRHRGRRGEYETINNMWTAFNSGGGAFGVHDYVKFRNDAEGYFFYRYYILPGEAGC